MAWITWMWDVTTFKWQRLGTLKPTLASWNLKLPENQSQRVGRWFIGSFLLEGSTISAYFSGLMILWFCWFQEICLTQRIHVWYVELHSIYHKNQLNVGTHTIYGSYGYRMFTRGFHGSSIISILNSSGPQPWNQPCLHCNTSRSFYLAKKGMVNQVWALWFLNPDMTTMKYVSVGHCFKHCFTVDREGKKRAPLKVKNGLFSQKWIIWTFTHCLQGFGNPQLFGENDGILVEWLMNKSPYNWVIPTLFWWKSS